ncbi:unnamed protein product [Dibothriocephalus latus]|uniref:Uncharacterized protein n=1 Tax=Dibothriocephalus latus TaxID=60516 RepID=A0A3P7NQ29_DIBLA|nr:unnamed protein product [Dibothriocephalus latus]
MKGLPEYPVNDVVKQNWRQDTAISYTRLDIERLREIVLHQNSGGGEPLVGLNYGNTFGRYSMQFHNSPQGLTMDGIEPHCEFDKADGRRLLGAMIEFQKAPQRKISGPHFHVQRGIQLGCSRPGVIYRLEPREKNTS